MTQFTQQTIQNTFNRSAPTYDQAALLAQEVCHRLCEQLQFIHLQPKIILDLGAGTAYANRLLKKQYPQAQIISLDLAEKLIQTQPEHAICAAAEHLPLQAQTIDLVFSNLMLPWCDDISGIFSEVYRVLTPGGLFLFSSFGAETLQEIQFSWEKIDTFPHVHGCYDLQDLGDLLVQQHFADPVMNSERLVVNYQNIQQLSQELKQSGLQNILQTRRRSLTGKRRWQEFLQQLACYQTPNGRLPISFDLMYGHAWRSNLARPQDGEVAIPISAIKRNRREKV